MKENTSEQKPKKKLNLTYQVIIGIVLGILVGYFSKTWGINLQILGTAFLNLIQMVIVPLVFPLIVLGIIGISNAKRFGKIAIKSLIYFEIVTTFLIVLGIVLGQVLSIGDNINVGNVDTSSLGGVAHSIDFKTFLLDIIPSNIFDAFASGNLLPIIFFAAFLGFSLNAIGEKAKPVVSFFESWSQAMFKLVEYAISFAPVGVFGFLAYDVAKYGLHNLISLGQFVLIAYAAFLITAVILFPIISLIFRVPYIDLLKNIGDLLLLTFTTGSSGVVMPSVIERLQKFGASRSVTSFVVPLGYSFNLDGASIYISLAVIFISNAFHQTLGLGQIITIVLFLAIITKGIAAVPSAVVVVLLAASHQLGLPAEGVALLMAVDFFVNMGRSSLNVIGNSLATVIIAKSEKEFDYTPEKNKLSFEGK
ncbi:cation:dicarboxylase symporter family transporter [Bacillus gobiensis]|uniref:dicarboxylate/amino acid:cation symporter n=1 Tax=Bacillus gobiensis TaxID=1441095 RepID=UPI003D2499FF